ncbi:MAG: (2Fe-2S)-binding protein [Candidatus Hodarchaeales archaeon]
MNIRIWVNDVLYEREVPADRRLLDFLRDDLGLKGTKEGCSQGECGSCSVILNGKVVTSCLVLMAQLPDESKVITVESDNKLLRSIQESFIEHGAAQCGACTPGMIISATALLTDNPEANDEAIQEGLSGVLCRCTGYTKIIDAVKDVQKDL